jgi:putative ABC transport system permease protein
VGGAVTLALAGGALGTVAALAVGRIIRHQLYSVGVFDPLTLGIVLVVLLACAVAASALPARRAARLDPGDALRQG